MKRREFLKSCAASPVALKALSGRGLFQGEKPVYDAKGLPTRVLGKTGVSVPLVGFGAGSRFCAVEDSGKSVEILTHALDHGFYYWDTAHDYGEGKAISEVRLGLVLGDRRNEVFLSTKTYARTYDGAMRDLEESLKRLRTDRLDIWNIHEVLSSEDAEKIGAAGGVLEALHKAKEEKVTRFIGFSGHSSAEAMTALAERHDFDMMLIALNHYEEHKGDMERGAIPVAAAKGLGINVIKVIRPREKVAGLDPADLIRYALSLPCVCAAVIGTDSVEVLKKNAETIKNFTVLGPEEMKKIRAGLSPFFEDEALPWMCPGYRDGLKV
jgi:aryl-alcohol dehydrogenase-like predicted oxidoreductase